VAALATNYAGITNTHVMMQISDYYAKTIQNAVSDPDFETKKKFTLETLKLMVD
jgi:hypothetical protein